MARPSLAMTEKGELRNLSPALLRQCALYGWALVHARAVVEHLGEALGVEAVRLHPFGQGEEVRVADRVRLAHHPRALEHLALDQLEAGADGFGDLALHVVERGLLVRP